MNAIATTLVDLTETARANWGKLTFALLLLAGPAYFLSMASAQIGAAQGN